MVNTILILQIYMFDTIFIQKLLKEERFHLFPSFIFFTQPLLFLSSFIQQLHAQYSSYYPATLWLNFCQIPVWCAASFIFDFWVWERVAWKSVFMALASISSFFCFIDVSYAKRKIAAFCFYCEALGFSKT